MLSNNAEFELREMVHSTVGWREGVCLANSGVQ